MSIIEKAVDKLIDSESTVGKPVKKRSPVLSERRGASASQAPQGRAAPAQPDKTADIPTREPDIALRTLALEGVLTPGTKRTRLAEEMRMIKRPILLKAFERGKRPSGHSNLVMITSAVEGEGKTFTALNLAISIATEMDRTVLLVDADLARPGLSRRLDIMGKPGLTDHLLDERTDLSDLLLYTDVPTLTVLPAGRHHTHSTELLASNNMKRLLDELARRYPDRVVLFDSPPLLATSEASVLGEYMGQIAMVVESASTPQHLVKEGLAQLDSTDNVSLILNKCTSDALTAYIGGYGYGKGYGYEYGNRGDH